MHIDKIQLQNKTSYPQQRGAKPTFNGVGEVAVGAVNKFFQVCDDVPMIGVSFMDTASAIAPRTVVDLHQAGIPAAAETFRRESSGLLVNCLIPGAFVYGGAKLFNNEWLKEFSTTDNHVVDLSRSWANGESIKNLVGVWKEYSGIDKDLWDLTDDAKRKVLTSYKKKGFQESGFLKSALKKIEGLNGVDEWEKLSDHKALIDKACEILTPQMKEKSPHGLIRKIKYSHSRNKAIQSAYDVLVTGVYKHKDKLGNVVSEVIEEGGGLKAACHLKFNQKAIGANLKDFLRDATDMAQALGSSKAAQLNPNKFVKKACGLVNAKSLAGLAVVLPLAMSMQKINRAITRHKYKKSGAPIYKDFENENRVLTDKEKKELKIAKPLAVASIVGLAALSMGKTIPKNLKSFAEMLQFNTKFPTVNQCRVIATATFASRMLAAEDPNELRESTVRDLASFAGLYFLGDYAEKIAAEGIQKFSKAGRSGKLEMFNRLKDPDEYKNVFQKISGWVKDKSVKSFDEIPKEFKSHRSLAKISGLGFSIALLGVILPMYNKHVTNKKEAKRKKLLEKQREYSNVYDPKEIFPSKEKSVEEIEKTELDKSKNKFSSLKDFSENEAFSKVATKFIDK